MDREKEIALLKERVRACILKAYGEEFADKQMMLYDDCFDDYYDDNWSPELIATEIVMGF